MASVGPLAALYYQMMRFAVAAGGRSSILEHMIAGAAALRAGDTPGNRALLGHLRRIFPELDEMGRKCLLRSYWKRHQRNMATLFYMRKMSPESLKGAVEWENRETLDRAAGSGRGVLLLVPHYGDERSLHILMGMAGYRVSVMTSRYLDMPPSVRKAKLTCGMKWNDLHFPGDSMRWIHRVLRGGDVVHFAPSAFGGPTGTWTMNFGVPVLVPSSPWKIHSRTGCDVVLGFNTQLPGMRFRISFSEPEDVSSQEMLTRSVISAAEEMAARHPDQYAWEQLLIRHRETNTIARIGSVPADETVLEDLAIPEDNDPELIADIASLKALARGSSFQ